MTLSDSPPESEIRSANAVVPSKDKLRMMTSRTLIKRTSFFKEITSGNHNYPIREFEYDFSAEFIIHCLFTKGNLRNLSFILLFRPFL